MKKLVDYIREMPIDKILGQPDVKERVDMYMAQNERFKDFLKKHTRLKGNVAITDARGITEYIPGNRFLVYSLFPACNISIRMIDGKGGEFTAFSVGYSILNKTSNVDVGKVMLRYGGGGHVAVGTCQVPRADADRVLGELVAEMNAK